MNELVLIIVMVTIVNSEAKIQGKHAHHILSADESLCLNTSADL